MGVKMLEKIERNCQNCGAPIDRRTMRCEYCGTEYKRVYDSTPIHFTVERPGVHRIRAEVRVDDELIRHRPEAAQKFAMDRLRKGLADGLLDYMKLCTSEEYDPRNFCHIIRGEVKVVDPRFDADECYFL
jgi:hypothetical protein